MKKRIHYFIVLFLMFIIFSSFTIAQQTFTRTGTSATEGPIHDLGKIINQIFEWLKPLFTTLLGEAPGDNISSTYLARIMFFVIILCLLFMTLRKMPLVSENDFVLWVVTIAVSILATRWLSNIDLVMTFLLPYNVLGLSIAGLFPLIIIFFFIEVVFQGRQYRFLRKFSWIFVGVLFIFLWVVRYDELTETTVVYGNWIYLISGVLCFLFSFVDKSIQTWFQKAKNEQRKAKEMSRLADKIELEIIDQEKILKAALRRPAPQYEIDDIKRKISELQKRKVDALT